MKTTVKFSRENENVIMPTKRLEDAGFDIYANLKETRVIKPHQTVMIPTGLRVAFDPGYALILKERGSTGTKGMGQRAGIIDSGFRGEIFVPITNHNEKDIVIKVKDDLFVYTDVIEYPIEKAVCQALLVPILDIDFEEITEEELKAIPSLRGEGAIGSSGK